MSHKSVSAVFRIEHFVYRMVILRGPKHAAQFLDAVINDRPPEKFARSHVNALCIRPSTPLRLVIQLLTTCSGLEWITSIEFVKRATRDVQRLVHARSRIHTSEQSDDGRKEIREKVNARKEYRILTANGHNTSSVHTLSTSLLNIVGVISIPSIW